MSRNNARQRKDGPKGARGEPFREDLRAEAVTVVWVVTILTTLAAYVAAMAAPALIARVWVREHPPREIAALPDLLLFVAAVTGSLCLLLTPIVHKLRTVPPPRAITVFALLVGAAPLATLLAVALKR